MPMYSKDSLLRIAKRFNNNRRTYLLVNPLQAKHMPVSPTAAIETMRTLGSILAQKYPKTRLVIGFAETATAVGAVVAGCISPKCAYIHTTREDLSDVFNWVKFQEEHSHAVEQKICGDSLHSLIAGTDCVIFVDDEISTGKTLINIVDQLKILYPILQKKKIVAASLLNRVSEENEARMQSAGICCECLLKLPEEDYSNLVSGISIHEAEQAEQTKSELTYQALFCDTFLEPRKGVVMQSFKNNCEKMAIAFLSQIVYKFKPGSSILVLGTEECMYPALVLGQELEQAGLSFTVRCHATTRSPIGINNEHDYPIRSGSKIPSFYGGNRDTYIYNLTHYDVAIVVSDARIKNSAAIGSLLGALRSHDIKQVYYIQNGRNVWCL